jgi:hypothetical protein
MTFMQDETTSATEIVGPDSTAGPDATAGPDPTATNWAELRAQAEKLGISLSELQQRDREKKMRLAKKNQSRTPVVPSSTPTE